MERYFPRAHAPKTALPSTPAPSSKAATQDSGARVTGNSQGTPTPATQQARESVEVKSASTDDDLKHTPARSTSTGQSPAAMPESPRPPRHSIEGAEQLLQGRAAVLVQGVRVLFLLEQGVQVRCLLQATRWKAGAGKLLVVSVAGAVSSSEEGPCSDNNTRDYGR